MKTAKATRKPTVRAKSKLKVKAKTKAAPRARAHATKKTKAKKTIRLGRKPLLRNAVLRKKPVARVAPPAKVMKKMAKAKTRRGPALGTVTPISDRPKKDRLDGRVFTHAHEYGRRVYVRFDTAGKELVEKAAGLSRMSPYIAHFASEAAHAGKKMPAMPVTTKEAGVFARFDSPVIKQQVKKIADASGVSLSAYAAYFAIEAAKAGKKMPGEKTATAAAS
jgi:hypothetical protein